MGSPFPENCRSQILKEALVLSNLFLHKGWNEGPRLLHRSILFGQLKSLRNALLSWKRGTAYLSETTATIVFE